MEPTLSNGDIIVIDMMAAKHGIFRGDIVKIVAVDKNDMIKRVVGLPGETVYIAENGIVSIDEVELDEPYTYGRSFKKGPVKVPEGHYFVLGDNRGNSWGIISIDSRCIGTIPANQIKGVARERVYFSLVRNSNALSLKDVTVTASSVSTKQLPPTI